VSRVSLAYREFTPTRPFERWHLPGVLAEQAQARADRPFLRWTDAGAAVSFARAYDIVGHLAGSLAAAGVRPDDRVVIFVNNSLANVWCWFAINTLGAVDAPINPAFFGSLLAHQIALVKPRLAICDASLRPTLDEGLRLAGIELPVLVHDGEPGAADKRAPLLQGTSPGAAPIFPAAGDPRLPATILYTSGTTGPSKGVLMPHAQMHFYSDQTANIHRMGEDDVYLTPFPLFHASGRVHGVYPALLSGGSCVLYDRFSATQFSERAAKSGATITNFLGSMVKLVLDQPPSPYDKACKLRSVQAVPTPFSLLEPFKARFGIENVAEVLGMTELSWPVMTPYGKPRPVGAAGLLVDEWYEAIVADPDTDQELPHGQTGEFLVRPRHPWITCLGYENMAAKTVETMRNLWFHSGDLARRDEEGWFYFVDRLKDSIRRRGENISSFDVEQALLAFPGVADAAAVAYKIPGEEKDEEILACLVPAPGATLEIDALAAHVGRLLPRFAVPRYYRLLDALPKTQSGKVQKAELRALGIAGAREVEPTKVKAS
jgi:crotonobetaine/carnitine-CoA ligase